MLKLTRQTVAVISIMMVTALFLDFTGTVHSYLGWMAKIQFLPALLSLNAAVIIGLIALTLLFGRLYCSVICPLGIMQDGFGWLGKKARKNRYSYSKAKNLLRYIMLGVMAVAIAFGISAAVALLAPYSAYGRIVSTMLQPIWIWLNNLLASIAETHESYAFYKADVWMKGIGTLIVAAVTLIALAILAWRNGRTYCNTICPVGTVLSFFARFSLFRPVIDKSKCVGCNLCSKNCKAACINIPEKKIDYSRCVTCFDCLEKCNKGAISYTYRRASEASGISAQDNPDAEKRQFLGIATAMLSTAALEAAAKTVDGGLAVIVDKKIPERKRKIMPPGAKGHNNLHSHCTACQLCVSACPNGVLRPSADVEDFMQPHSSYERGYCRPECTRCSEVCPAGAIVKISREDKSSVQIGHAVWVKDNCVPLTDGVECGNCARHCPTGAITMIESAQGVKIPAINTERCIGCGACENLCPARPFSAIYVEGHEQHRTI